MVNARNSSPSSSSHESNTSQPSTTSRTTAYSETTAVKRRNTIPVQVIAWMAGGPATSDKVRKRTTTTVTPTGEMITRQGRLVSLHTCETKDTYEWVRGVKRDDDEGTSGRLRRPRPISHHGAGHGSGGVRAEVPRPSRRTGRSPRPGPPTMEPSPVKPPPPPPPPVEPMFPSARGPPPAQMRNSHGRGF